MAELPSILTPSTTPGFQIELDLLASVISLAKGRGSFSIVVCNTVPLRERAVARLRASHPNLRHVPLPAGCDDPFRAVSQSLPVTAATPDAVVVSDFSFLDPVAGPRALTALNLSREAWFGRFPCAVIFFVSAAELPLLIRQAPDFWSWKSHFFELSEESGAGSSAISTPAFPATSADELSREARTARITELRGRIQAAGPGEESRAIRWLLELRQILRAQGDYQAALEASHSAVRIAEAEDDPILLANCLNELSLDLQDLGDLPGARTRMERAIAIDEKHFDPDHPTLAISYSNLATILRGLGDLPGARTRMERAIVIQQKHFDPDHPTLATSYSNLAMILQDLGDLPGARTRMERAIAIQQKHFDPDHPTLATSYGNLALILKDLGDLPGAHTRMERAIAIDEKHFDPDHPTLATRYSNLATILRDLGDLPGARTRMERAIAIQQKHFDPDHPTLATRYNNLAFIERDAGNVPAAVALWREAHAIVFKALGPEHPYTKDVAAMLRKYDPPGPAE